MKTKLLLFAFAALSILTFTNCGGSDDDDNGDSSGNGNGTEITTDYTATNKIKSITLTQWKGSKFDKGIYEDFNRFYTFGYYSGRLYIVPYSRKNGHWNCYLDKGTSLFDNDLYVHYDSSYGIGIKDIGKVDGLAAITEKCDPTNGDFPQLQPYHGYAMSFTTEDNEIKYLRVYCKGVKKNDYGSLDEIYLQYQLY